MKPPSPKGKRVECQDLSGRVAIYEAEAVTFRPAAYGILVQEGAVLLARSRFTGLWDFPGGGVEPFEPLAEGMAREFQEETGLRVAAEALVYVAEGFIAMFGRPYHSLRFYYRCRLAEAGGDGIAPELSEIDELRWWPLTEIPRDAMHVHDLTAFERTMSS
ncbi:MAG: NUDIX domain-containing protein [Firmicutes bacterium]|nr:NUDIX domain-containing protein [Bacillota bacterium]